MRLFSFYFPVALLGQAFTLVSGLEGSDTTIVDPAYHPPQRQSALHKLVKRNDEIRDQNMLRYRNMLRFRNYKEYLDIALFLMDQGSDDFCTAYCLAVSRSRHPSSSLLLMEFFFHMRTHLSAIEKTKSQVRKTFFANRSRVSRPSTDGMRSVEACAERKIRGVVIGGRLRNGLACRKDYNSDRGGERRRAWRYDWKIHLVKPRGPVLVTSSSVLVRK